MNTYIPRLKARARPSQPGSSFSDMDHRCQSVEGGILNYLEGTMLADAKEHPAQFKSIFLHHFRYSDISSMGALMRAADDG